jgi:hypothetical protein
MNIQIKDGVVTNDGDEIGKIEGDTCFLPAKVGPTVKGAIKKAAGNPALTFVAGTEDQRKQELDEHPIVATASALSDDELAAEMLRRGMIKNEPDAPVIVQPPVVERDLSAVERLHNLAKEGKIPHPPAKHPAMGDKTPDYVEWFKAHATPDEIAVRYPDNRRVPATVQEFERADAKLQDKLPGEKKDTAPENDFVKESE